MQIMYEKDQEGIKKGGVTYMMRGPQIDWGVIELAPSEEKSPHYHEHLAETFYVMEGTMTFVLEDQEIDLPTGTAIRLTERESHGLKNKSQIQHSKVIFIKEQYLPKDKVDC